GRRDLGRLVERPRPQQGAARRLLRQRGQAADFVFRVREALPEGDGGADGPDRGTGPAGRGRRGDHPALLDGVRGRALLSRDAAQGVERGANEIRLTADKTSSPLSPAKPGARGARSARSLFTAGEFTA